MTQSNKADLFTPKSRKEWIDITNRLKRRKVPEVPKICIGCPWLVKTGDKTFYCFSGNTYPNCIRRNAS